eukprot:TRINITY_DN5503_c0_g1_i4.p1 TRINITY_DN5503_c0_g1~~TRINITY_DN5503_c0_g1_i4.p1  ORF type:complete len:162 (+),score=3.54 TRINITY_DN5503_c0_g1_i4:649-1134(+)
MVVCPGCTCGTRCNVGLNCLKVTSGLLLLTASLVLVTAFVLQNVVPNINHYPFFLVYCSTPVAIMILTLHLSCSQTNYFLKLFLILFSYALVNLGGVIFFLSVWDVEMCSNAGKGSITQPACDSAYASFLGTLILCASQILLGLVIGKDAENSDEYASIEG